MSFVKNSLAFGLPFVFGFLLASGIYGKDIAWVLLGAYLVGMLLFNFLFAKLFKVKESVDEKISMRKKGKIILKKTEDYVFEGHSIGFGVFDKWFGYCSIYFGIILLFFVVYFLFIQNWVWAFVCFCFMLFYVIQVQIWRGIKNVWKD